MSQHFSLWQKSTVVGFVFAGLAVGYMQFGIEHVPVHGVMLFAWLAFVLGTLSAAVWQWPPQPLPEKPSVAVAEKMVGEALEAIERHKQEKEKRAAEEVVRRREAAALLAKQRAEFEEKRIKGILVSKKGARVTPVKSRPVDAERGPSWSSYMDSFIGKIGTVTGTNAVGYVMVEFDNQQTWFYLKHWLLPAPAVVPPVVVPSAVTAPTATAPTATAPTATAPTATAPTASSAGGFVVGQSVTPIGFVPMVGDIRQWAGSMDEFIGKVGVVRAVHPGSLTTVHFPCTPANEWCYKNEWLVPIDVKTTFPVGSKVKVVNFTPKDCNQYPTWSGSMNSFMGKEGTVAGQDGNRNTVTVDFGNGSVFSYKLHWLIPQPAPKEVPAPEKQEEVAKQPSEPVTVEKTVEEVSKSIQQEIDNEVIAELKKDIAVKKVELGVSGRGCGEGEDKKELPVTTPQDHFQSLLTLMGHTKKWRLLYSGIMSLICDDAKLRITSDGNVFAITGDSSYAHLRVITKEQVEILKQEFVKLQRACELQHLEKAEAVNKLIVQKQQEIAAKLERDRERQAKMALDAEARAKKLEEDNRLKAVQDLQDEEMRKMAEDKERAERELLIADQARRLQEAKEAYANGLIDLQQQDERNKAVRELRLAEQKGLAEAAEAKIKEIAEQQAKIQKELIEAQDGLEKLANEVEAKAMKVAEQMGIQSHQVLDGLASGEQEWVEKVFARAEAEINKRVEEKDAEAIGTFMGHKIDQRVRVQSSKDAKKADDAHDPLEVVNELIREKFSPAKFKEEIKEYVGQVVNQTLAKQYETIRKTNDAVADAIKLPKAGGTGGSPLDLVLPDLEAFLKKSPEEALKELTAKFGEERGGKLYSYMFGPLAEEELKAFNDFCDKTEKACPSLLKKDEAEPVVAEYNEVPKRGIKIQHASGHKIDLVDHVTPWAGLHSQAKLDKPLTDEDFLEGLKESLARDVHLEKHQVGDKFIAKCGVVAPDHSFVRDGYLRAVTNSLAANSRVTVKEMEGCLEEIWKLHFAKLDEQSKAARSGMVVLPPTDDAKVTVRLDAGERGIASLAEFVHNRGFGGSLLKADKLRVIETWAKGSMTTVHTMEEWQAEYEKEQQAKKTAGLPTDHKVLDLRTCPKPATMSNAEWVCYNFHTLDDKHTVIMIESDDHVKQIRYVRTMSLWREFLEKEKQKSRMVRLDLRQAGMNGPDFTPSPKGSMTDAQWVVANATGITDTSTLVQLKMEDGKTIIQQTLAQWMEEAKAAPEVAAVEAQCKARCAAEAKEYDVMDLRHSLFSEDIKTMLVPAIVVKHFPHHSDGAEVGVVQLDGKLDTRKMREWRMWNQVEVDAKKAKAAAELKEQEAKAAAGAAEAAKEMDRVDAVVNLMDEKDHPQRSAAECVTAKYDIQTDDFNVSAIYLSGGAVTKTMGEWRAELKDQVAQRLKYEAKKKYEEESQAIDAKFPVGSKVKVVDQAPDAAVSSIWWNPEMGKTCGKVGTVLPRIGTGVRVLVADTQTSWNYDPAWLTPLGESIEADLQKQFPVGCTVKVVDKRPAWDVNCYWNPGDGQAGMDSTLGKTGSVVRVELDGTVLVQFDRSITTGDWCYNPAWLTVIKEDDAITYKGKEYVLSETELQTPAGVIRVGGKVKVVDTKPADAVASYAPYWNVQMDATCGMVGTVERIGKYDDPQLKVSFVFADGKKDWWNYKSTWVTPFDDGTGPGKPAPAPEPAEAKKEPEPEKVEAEKPVDLNALAKPEVKEEEEVRVVLDVRREKDSRLLFMTPRQMMVSDGMLLHEDTKTKVIFADGSSQTKTMKEWRNLPASEQEAKDQALAEANLKKYLAGEVVTVVQQSKEVKGPAVEVVAVKPQEPAVVKEPTLAEEEPKPVETSLHELFPEGSFVKVIDKRPTDGNSGPKWLDDMDETCGKVGKVHSVGIHGAGNNDVLVNICGTYWNYKPTWLTLVKEDAADKVVQYKVVQKEPEKLKATSIKPFEKPEYTSETLNAKFPRGTLVKVTDKKPSDQDYDKSDGGPLWVAGMDDHVGQEGKVGSCWMGGANNDVPVVRVDFPSFSDFPSWSYRTGWITPVKELPKPEPEKVEAKPEPVKIEKPVEVVKPLETKADLLAAAKLQFPLQAKVKVIDKKPDDWMTGPYWTDEMDSAAGKVGTVVSVAVYNGIPYISVTFKDIRPGHDVDNWSYKTNWISVFNEETTPAFHFIDLTGVLKPGLSATTLTNAQYVVANKQSLPGHDRVKVMYHDICGSLREMTRTMGDWRAIAKGEIEQPKPAIAERFPVGSKVKIADKKPDNAQTTRAGWNSQMDATLGQVGTVKRVDQEMGYISVTFDNKALLPDPQTAWAYMPDWVTVVKDEPVALEKQFPVGSKVKVIDEKPTQVLPGPGWNHIYMDSTLSKEGRVVSVGTYGGKYVVMVEFGHLPERDNTWGYLPEWLQPAEPKKKLTMLELRQKYLGGVKGNEPHDVNQAIKGDDSRSMKFTTVGDGDVYLTENEFAKLGKPPYLSLTPLNHEEWVYWVNVSKEKPCQS